jgi:hypothetical protein
MIDACNLKTKSKLTQKNNKDQAKLVRNIGEGKSYYFFDIQ